MCGNGKYLTKLCWKLSIFVSKALVSCIFPKNIANFCDFIENTYMGHSLNQNIPPKDLKECPLFASKMVYFTSPKWFIFIVPVKKAVKKLLWTDFHILPSESISTKQFQLKTCPLSGLTTQENKVRVPSLSLVNQLHSVWYSHASHQTNSIFSLQSVSTWSKIIIDNFFINASQ